MPSRCTARSPEEEGVQPMSVVDENTTVAIVGSGVAGLALGNFLLRSGIDCVILESAAVSTSSSGSGPVSSTTERHACSGSGDSRTGCSTASPSSRC
ncbi:FAD-dependent monooxygenase [Streptomyces sp. NPDC127074]|uniref:FAD-dependent monooxygenase n=1 Tax=Streptomyces sp. NPDC127074 TaxID=3347130 RepID=UPI00365BC2C5